MCLCACARVCLFVCVPSRLSVCLCVRTPVCLSLCGCRSVCFCVRAGSSLSARRFVSVCTPVCKFACLRSCLFLSACVSVCHRFFMPVFQSVFMPVFQSLSSCVQVFLPVFESVFANGFLTVCVSVFVVSLCTFPPCTSPSQADLRHRNKPMLLDRIERLPIQPGYSCSQFMKLFDLMDFHPLPRRPTLIAHARPVARVLQHIFQHHWCVQMGVGNRIRDIPTVLN